MAVSATDILSLADAKHEFQVEDSDVSEDTRVGGIINQAVSLVGRISGLPLVDREKGSFVIPNPLAVVFFPFLHVKAVVSVKYWEDESEARTDPTHTVSDTLGRTQIVPYKGTLIYPPANGWPGAYNGVLLVTCNVGVDLDNTNEDIRTAVILVARQIYNGHPDVSVPQYLLYNLGSFGA